MGFFCFVTERGRVAETITQQPPCLHRSNTNYQNREYTQQGRQVLVFNYFKARLNFDEAQPGDTSAYVQFRPCAHSIKPKPRHKDSRPRSASSQHEAQDVKEGSCPPPAPTGPGWPSSATSEPPSSSIFTGNVPRLLKLPSPCY